MMRLWLAGLLMATAGCVRFDDTATAASTSGSGSPATQAAAETKWELATFAGGCFWCMETPYEEMPGIRSVISGFSGGTVENPTYRQVCNGGTGHAEAVQITFDPSVISYETLLDVFWRQIDPTDPGGQFADRGDTYRTEIFYHDEAQRKAAEASKQALIARGMFLKPIVTAITPYKNFYPAEEYHQDYSKKNAEDYKRYRKGSGRERYLQQTWGDDQKVTPPRTYAKPSDEELRKRLTDLQYRVTQEAATEPPFRNEYWDNKAEGIYVDIVTGEPLFSSKDKFKSGTGWPSFTRPLVAENIARDVDHHLGYPRTEVRSKHGDSHLGHVFDDGPEPTGLRYCINSAALMFIPKAELEKSGYGEFAKLFEK